MCVCVCVWVGERERERECVCVCVIAQDLPFLESELPMMLTMTVTAAIGWLFAGGCVAVTGLAIARNTLHMSAVAPLLAWGKLRQGQSQNHTVAAMLDISVPKRFVQSRHCLCVCVFLCVSFSLWCFFSWPSLTLRLCGDWLTLFSFKMVYTLLCAGLGASAWAFLVTWRRKCKVLV